MAFGKLNIASHTLKTKTLTVGRTFRVVRSQVLQVDAAVLVGVEEEVVEDLGVRQEAVEVPPAGVEGHAVRLPRLILVVTSYLHYAHELGDDGNA